MKSAEAIGVVQFGATGPVAEKFRQLIASSNAFELEAIATATHPDLHNKKLGETYIEHPPSLADVPITGIVSAAENTDAPLAFSGLSTKMATRYERRIAKTGKLVVTNASANRMESDVALVSPFVNLEHIDELYAQDIEDKIIGGGNCMVDIMLPAVAAIHRSIGIHTMSIKSLQGWSGAGAKEVPKNVGDNTARIEGDEQDKIQTEPNKILGKTIGEPENILIGAEPERAPWLDGHKAEIVLNLDRETSKQEIEELLRHFEAPKALYAVRPMLRLISRVGGDRKWPGRHSPIHPIKLEHCPLVREDLSPRRLDRLQPMRSRAHVISLDPEDPSRVIIEVSGHNTWLGAVGGNMLNAAYARSQGYI